MHRCMHRQWLVQTPTFYVISALIYAVTPGFRVFHVREFRTQLKHVFEIPRADEMIIMKHGPN